MKKSSGRAQRLLLAAFSALALGLGALAGVIDVAAGDKDEVQAPRADEVQAPRGGAPFR
jgi:hypothetical protein